jgi:hypothetical protein
LICAVITVNKKCLFFLSRIIISDAIFVDCSIKKIDYYYCVIIIIIIPVLVVVVDSVVVVVVVVVGLVHFKVFMYGMKSTASTTAVFFRTPER